MLIPRCFDIEAVSRNRTALCMASAGGHVDIVEILLQAGANVDAAPKGGTPLCLAAEAGYASVLQALLDGGADVSEKRADGRSALDLATERKHKSVVKVLKGKAVSLPYCKD